MGFAAGEAKGEAVICAVAEGSGTSYTCLSVGDLGVASAGRTVNSEDRAQPAMTPIDKHSIVVFKAKGLLQVIVCHPTCEFVRQSR